MKKKFDSESQWVFKKRNAFFDTLRQEFMITFMKENELESRKKIRNISISLVHSNYRNLNAKMKVNQLYFGVQIF